MVLFSCFSIILSTPQVCSIGIGFTSDDGLGPLMVDHIMLFAGDDDEIPTPARGSLMFR